MAQEDHQIIGLQDCVSVSSRALGVDILYIDHLKEQKIV